MSKLVWLKKGALDQQRRDIEVLLTSVETMDWGYIEHWAAYLTVVDLLREVRS